jgi:hypothetical protein
VTGLDYYDARYYDPVVGVFLSVDSVQGNMLGFDPYMYVSGNPETMNDPTGHWGWLDTVAVIAAVVVVAAVVAAVVVCPIVAAALIPAIPALSTSTLIGMGVGAGIGGAVGAGASIVTDTTSSGGNPDPGSLFRDTIVGGTIGAIGGATAPAGTVLSWTVTGICGVGAGAYDWWAGNQSWQQSQQQSQQQMTATYNQGYQDGTQSGIELGEQIQKHDDMVKKQRKEVATGSKWRNKQQRRADNRWRSVYSSLHPNASLISEAALYSETVYNTQENDFIRQESNLFLRYE